MFLSAITSKLSLLYFQGLNYLAGSGNVWSNINHATSQGQTQLTSISKGLFILVVILGGILFAFGSRINQTAKQIITYALAGAAIVALATSIIPAVSNLFGGK